MAVLTCKTQDGKLLTDGAIVKGLVLAKGSPETRDYSEATLSGTIRAVEHVERVLDGDGYAVAKTVETRWEITTLDPQHPAIGFLPENALTRTGG